MVNLDEIYYDPKDRGSYNGVDKDYRRATEAGVKNLIRNKVKQFLSDQQSYSLHMHARRNFTGNPTYVKGIDHQWQADLADTQGLRNENEQFN